MAASAEAQLGEPEVFYKPQAELAVRISPLWGGDVRPVTTFVLLAAVNAQVSRRLSERAIQAA
jgi:hypothetical protein